MRSLPRRPLAGLTTEGRRGLAVASAHPLSTAAGLEVLLAGGNAYDAALAVSAALPVVQPHMNGLGSDFFAVVRDGRSIAVNSSGPAARRATPEQFGRWSMRRIPRRGPLAALTVPGLVAAWRFFGDRARSGFELRKAPAGTDPDGAVGVLREPVQVTIVPGQPVARIVVAPARTIPQVNALLCACPEIS